MTSDGEHSHPLGWKASDANVSPSFSWLISSSTLIRLQSFQRCNLQNLVVTCIPLQRTSPGLIKLLLKINLINC